MRYEWNTIGQRPEWNTIGHVDVGVDTASIAICDPRYCRKSIEEAVQKNNAVIFATRDGEGIFDVEARYDAEGLICEIRIRMKRIREIILEGEERNKE